MTTIQQYSIAWSDRLIHRVEGILRDVHFTISEYYETHAFERRYSLKNASSNSASSPEGQANQDPAASIDAVSPAGSFMLRTSVHKTPFEDDHVHSGISVDAVVTIPPERCTEEDVKSGCYLQRRQEFLKEIESYLKKVQQAALRSVKDEKTGDSSDGKQKESSAATASATLRRKERLSRMDVQVLPMHSSFGCHDKYMIQLRFHRRLNALQTSLGKVNSPFETPFINLHFRLSMQCGGVWGAKAIKKHPLYSYLILEDYLMPSYLQKLHQLCVQSAGLRRAIVLLKCWALHFGLDASTSGHAENLNGFIISAMILSLVEEGVVSAGMNEEMAARAVLVHISNGGFTSHEAAAGSVVPQVERKGEVAVLRLQGEGHNILFRSTASFFRSVVEPAAKEALQYPKLLEMFSQKPFQPFSLRQDISLLLSHTSEVSASMKTWNSDIFNSTSQFHPSLIGSESAAATPMPPPSAAYFSAAVMWAQKVQSIAVYALESRAREVVVWATSSNSFQLRIALNSEADGRRRLTRGPPMEDAKAVEAFNTFWGSEKTSTRQFADGAIYRCVRWDFPEGLSSAAVMEYILFHAFEKHLGEEKAPLKDISVKSLLGGLEGFLTERIGGEWQDAARVSQTALWDASKTVQSLISGLPKNAVPCKITGFDIISASERHSEAFPILPHFALTFTTSNKEGATPTTAKDKCERYSIRQTIEPVHCVLTIDDRRRIPDDLEAIQLMKAAIGAQLSKSLQQAYGSLQEVSKEKLEKNANAPAPRIYSSCHDMGLDVAVDGYLFRIYIAHYREVSLLRALQMTPKADILEQKLFWTVQHAKLLRTIAFGHQSFSLSVRLAKRWLSAMGLYEFIIPEVVELLVAHAFLLSHESSVGSNGVSNGVTIPPPRNGISGFIRFVELLATHDWTTPLVLPTTDTGSETSGMGEAADLVRKQKMKELPHQAMFIATPYAPTESPFTTATPRTMIVHRLVALAKNALSLILRFVRQMSCCVHNGDQKEVKRATEALLFRADTSVYDMALPFHPKAILFPDRALQIASCAQAPESLKEPSTEDPSSALFWSLCSSIAAERVWQLDEWEDVAQRASYITQRVERDPAALAVRKIRAALREKAMVFYDALSPSFLYIVALTGAPLSTKESWNLTRMVCEAGGGAVLPQPVFCSPSGNSVASESTGNGKDQRHARMEKKGKKSTAGTSSGRQKPTMAASHENTEEEEETNSKALKKTSKRSRPSSVFDSTEEFEAKGNTSIAFNKKQKKRRVG